MNHFGSRCSLIIIILVLGVCPVGATVAGDMAAKLPLEKVITNGLAAGLTIEAVLGQALDAGANPENLFKAAMAQGGDLSRTMKYFMDKCATDSKFKDTCASCNLMKWAKESGKDSVEIANAMMAAGADLQQVRECLASMGYTGTYEYTPGAVPMVPAGIGPTFPGGGGGGGTGGGGGGLVSPSS
jgi:hypothetical protein